MTLSCKDASALVPSYLDGELSEVQASPLRAHLIDCPHCREAAKHETALKRWFQSAREARAQVPEGFAAHVARRAFSGDRGLAVPAASGSEGRLLPFVLALSAVAAVILLVLSIALQSRERPAGEGLEADERAPWLAEPADAQSAAGPEPVHATR